MEKFGINTEKRMTEIIKKMRLLCNLSSKNNYNYTDKHIKEIIRNLEEELDILKSKFKQEKERD